MCKELTAAVLRDGKAGVMMMPYQREKMDKEPEAANKNQIEVLQPKHTQELRG